LIGANPGEADGGELVVGDRLAGDVFAVVHPRAVTLLRVRPDGTPRNVWQGRVEEVDDEGTIALVRVGGVPPIVAEVTAAAVADIGLTPGVEVWVSVKATEIVLYPA
jgi:molybdate transport system ATP-binding protein